MLTPHVSSKVVIQNNPVVPSSTNDIRVLCVFYSSEGPTEPTLINSPDQFKDLYLPSGLKVNDHISLASAYKLAQTTKLLAIRASSSTVITGRDASDNTYSIVSDQWMKYKDTYEISLSNEETHANPKFKKFDPNDKSTYQLRVGNHIFTTTPEEVDGVVPTVIEVSDGKWQSMLTEFVSKIKDYLESYLGASVNIVNHNISQYADVVVSGSTDAYLRMIVLHRKTELIINTEDNSGMIVKEKSTHVDETPTIASQKTDPALIFYLDYQSRGNRYEVTVKDVKKLGDFSKFTVVIKDLSDNSTESYELTTDPDSLDRYGFSNYAESINELHKSLNIKVVNGSYSAMQTFKANTPFKVGASALAPESDIDGLLVNALDIASDYKSARISIISDLGHTDPIYQSKLSILADTFKAELYLSVPDSPLSLIKQWNTLPIPGVPWRVVKVAGWNAETSLFPRKVILPVSVYVIESIVRNAAGNIEYAPLYAPTTGRVQANRLTKDLSAIAEDLQLLKINPPLRDSDLSATYMLNNLTSHDGESDITEEHVARLINNINYEVDVLLRQFISYDWDDDTCYKIKNIIKSFFNRSIYSLGRLPLQTGDSGLAINAELNGRNRIKVSVDVLTKGSVKYINAYYNVITVNSN